MPGRLLSLADFDVRQLSGVSRAVLAELVYDITKLDLTVDEICADLHCDRKLCRQRIDNLADELRAIAAKAAPMNAGPGARTVAAAEPGARGSKRTGVTRCRCCKDQAEK